VSARSSWYYHEDEKGEVHMYEEMHDDGLVHLYIHDKTNSEVNIVLPERHAKLLYRALEPNGRHYGSEP
jgi:hypothetical protein